MRRFVVFAGPLVAAAFAFACEDDPSSSPGTQFPEAGTFDSSRPEFDSSVPDAGPGPDAATPQPVTVVVSDFVGGPVQDVTVVFHDASGAVLETKKTDTFGKATSAVNPAVAMATVALRPTGPQRELLTWTGVQGGDVLPVVLPPNDTIAQFEINLPGQFTGDGGPTFNYTAQIGGCQAYSTIPNEPITVYVDPYCYRGMGAVLVSGSNANDVIVAHALKKPVASVTDAGLVTVTTDAWKAPPSDVTVSIANTTDTTGRTWFQQIANQTAFPESKDLGDVYQAQFKAASGTFVEGYNASVFFTTGFQATRVLGKRVAPTATVAFDATQLPPALTAAAVDPNARKRPVATWTGNMGAMKGGLVRMSWMDMQQESYTKWSIVVPANNAATGTITAPALPATFDDILPLGDGGGNAWEATPEVTFVDSDLLPDYAAWRKLQGVVLPFSIVQGGNVEQAVLPQNGSFRITNWHPYFD